MGIPVRGVAIAAFAGHRHAEGHPRQPRLQRHERQCRNVGALSAYERDAWVASAFRRFGRHRGLGARHSLPVLIEARGRPAGMITLRGNRWQR